MSSPRPTPEPERSERHALLVANSRYLDAKLHRLRAPAEDAGHLKDLLLDPAVGFFDTVTKIVDGTKGEIEEQLEALFLDREPGDLVLLYVSTHGIKNDQGELFFAASNTKLALPRSTAVSGALVQGVLEDCRASTKLVLLDCCYSGAFTRGMVPKAADVPVAQLAGRGTCVITATDELQYAFEGEHQYLDRDVHRSVFTSAVIKGLETGDADLDRDGVVTGDELYRYVFAEVRRQGKQTPTRHNQLQGDFTVARTRLAMGPLRPAGKPVVVTLDRVLPAHADGEAPVERVPLSAPVGQLAEPLGHSGIVQLDLTGHGGHVAVVGQLHSGKSTFLQTLVVSLSLTHSADEALFFCVDPGGQLVGLDRLPHVRAVIDSAERGPRLSRMLAHLTRTLDERRMLFRQRRITSAEKFRAARRDPDFPAGQHADLFLVVDGWEQATRDHPELARAVHTLASAGLHFCLHVLVTARSWRELPPDLERLLLGRVELRLSDPAESRIDPDLAATLPQRSGVGLHDGGRFVIAAPEVDGASGYDLDELMEPAEATAEPDWILQDAPPAPVDEPPRVPSLPELLGLPASPTPETVRDAWRRRPAARRLCVPFGVDERGEPVRLDIKEAAMEGMGPHGLCIGATGSGKSELLRTLVLGMLATHSPDELNVVLVDYKGGATFLGLDEAPHVSAVITNLADDAALVDRMRDALFGEMNRRQEALKNGGNFKNVWEYEKARENGADLEPLPALFIVVDEFSELLSAKPDFIDLFVAIGRLGRSLQMHLLLASQRLEEGKLRGLDSHLSYRIGLRTFSAMESRVAIGMPDAYELPREPGVGYLTYDTSTLVRFKAAYVSGPRPPDGTSDLASLVAALPRVAGARRIWLPPLDAAPTLADLLPPLALTDRGFGPAVGAEVGTLRVPVGIVDRPYEQRRDPLWADFSGASGHGVVVGGPQSGKSTVLRTLIMSLALTHTPEEVQFYCVDLGGGTLAGLAELPHVGGVAVARREPDKARRIVAELATLAAEREARFGELGVDSMADFRNRKRRGEITAEQDPFGDAFLVVDGWRAVRDDFEELEPQITKLAAQGLTYGVHVIITSNRWADIRPAIKDMLGTRFELRLGDPSESDIDRRVAANVPAGRPGRGLTREKLHMLTALPRVDGSSDAANLATGVAHTVAEIRRAWQGPAAPPVRLLPDVVSYDDLLRRCPRRDSRLVPIGIEEQRLEPVYLDFDAEPHFVAFGDGESGKTNLLRQIAHGIVERYSKQEAVIILVDFRRTMLGYVEGDQLLGYAVSAPQLTEMMKDVAGSMTKRLPGPDVTPQQLKNRSWWTGPELFLIVDDYDLVVTQTSNPLKPLSEFLAQAKDVGLHMIVARRTGGASRALYDPILGTLRELGAPGIVLSGPRDEGVLLGDVRPRPMRPGRGTHVSRRAGTQLVQVSWIPPE